jgi:hypothetical protein
MFVLTVDQQRSRRTPDQVDALLRRLADRGDRFVRAFERTAGDEVQGIVADPGVVVDLTLELVREGSWSIGIGIGPVDEPLPASTRAGSGPAFVLARESVTRAKSRPTGLAVSGQAAQPARHVQAVLDLLAATVQRRSARGWEAVDLAARGLTQVEIAERLGISKQAVSQRLLAADWHVEPDGRALSSHLLSIADGRLGEP